MQIKCSICNNLDKTFYNEFICKISNNVINKNLINDLINCKNYSKNLELFNMNVQIKKDITRLKNLLDRYRDHIITEQANKRFKLLDTIKYVDDAIFYFKQGLKGV